MPASRSPFDALGDQPFVSLSTFRRTGVAVATPVWIGRDGDALVVLTPADSGKVKRARNDARVSLRPCDRRGRVTPGSVRVEGSAEILPESETPRIVSALRRKYGLEFPVVMFIERIVARGQKKRVVLRITPAVG